MKSEKKNPKISDEFGKLFLPLKSRNVVNFTLWFFLTYLDCFHLKLAFY